ncbi:hypothetical protein, partial [Xanthomonas albilineans]|uniref:hypothetical protein n=2 Tax=Xanthomonas albilineans TaxID=29447 RepID=UPI001E3A5FA3
GRSEVSTRIYGPCMARFMGAFMVFAPQPVFAALDQPEQVLALGLATEGITEGPVDGSGMKRFMVAFMVCAAVGICRA